jgi:hypothetical protein
VGCQYSTRIWESGERQTRIAESRQTSTNHVPGTERVGVSFRGRRSVLLTVQGRLSTDLDRVVSLVLGRYDRTWGPERLVYGTIRYMSSESTLKKGHAREYLRRYSP